MTPRAAYVAAIALPAALRLLPHSHDTPRARALVLAIGLQESRLEARRQLPTGPARGFWQFERGGGVRGVLTHRLTQADAAVVCHVLGYPLEAAAVHAAIEHNDVLAAAFARLLLFTDPRRLPGPTDVEAGWAIYLDTWRPGKPHAHTWAANVAHAWELVEAADGGVVDVEPAALAVIQGRGRS